MVQSAHNSPWIGERSEGLFVKRQKEMEYGIDLGRKPKGNQI